VMTIVMTSRSRAIVEACASSIVISRLSRLQREIWRFHRFPASHEQGETGERRLSQPLNLPFQEAPNVAIAFHRSCR
jgi:hypothetical protein